jgi:outer membrane protein OmpA-like peptidoglycan-associated protein
MLVASSALIVGVFSFVSIDKGLSDDTPAIASYPAIISPRFEMSYRRGNLRLAGHTESIEHEHQLLQAAERVFSSAQTSTAFKPLGPAPDYWAAASISLLTALSATRSSHAVLTDNVLQIRGVGTEDWYDELQFLRVAFQERIEFDVDMVMPDENVRTQELCSRAFAADEHGPVGFEESMTVLRSSAMPVLDRVISLADACRHSTISITGHTDSSGDEAWNSQLSLARANAVADYFAEHGIARERLITIGAGSSQPVADNATRYGRGLNRRIDIRLRRNAEAKQSGPD